MMNLVQNVLGGGLIAGFGLFVTDVVFPPPPIVIHSLTYSDGIIYQDRTVSTESGSFFAKWTAEILDGSGHVVPFCSGTGTWDYPAGHYTAPIPLNEWTGKAECTPEALREVGVVFVPRASWIWGDNKVGRTGRPFRP